MSEMGEGEDRNGKRRRNGEEDVILRLLKDDARARRDDSHIRWYLRRDERAYAEKCISRGLFNCAMLYAR